MKRVLSLALAGAIALGMGMSSFATVSFPDLENIKDFAAGKDLSDGVKNYSTANQVVDMGTVVPMDKPELIIDLRTDMFGEPEINGTETTYYVVDVDKMSREGILSNAPSTYTSFGAIDHDIITQAQTNNDDKNLNFTRPFYGALSVNNSERATRLFNAYRQAGFVTTVDKDDATAVYFETHMANDGNWAAGSELRIANQKNFTNRNLSATEIRKSKLGVGSTVKGDRGLIKSLELVNKDGQIVMKVIDEFVSTKSADLETHIYLTVNGKRLDNKGLTVLATVENRITEVYSNYNYVNLSEGYVAEAMDFNSKIAVDLGNGVTIHTKFFKNKKYYGIATRDNDEENERVLKQYKDVDNVLTLKVVGLNNAGDKITLNNDYADYFVYDKDLNYLGKGTEELNFSSKLYLAYNKLDVEEDDDEEEVEAPVPTTPENPETGGDGNAAGNVNLNPGTGR